MHKRHYIICFQGEEMSFCRPLPFIDKKIPQVKSSRRTYTCRSTLVPNKAELLIVEKRISTFGSYLSDSTLFVDDSADRVGDNVKDLDSEGRAVVVDVGLFALINVY